MASVICIINFRRFLSSIAHLLAAKKEDKICLDLCCLKKRLPKIADKKNNFFFFRLKDFSRRLNENFEWELLRTEAINTHQWQQQTSRVHCSNSGEH